ncbi:MAG: hypothetical protein E7168_04765, partial [Firmicutes bacterium]|nr:hypothetical protein [Bacillota bacterium]
GSTSTSGITYKYGTSASPTANYSSVSVSTNTAGANHYFRACNGAGTCSSDTLYVAKLDKSTPAAPTISATDGKTSGNWHTANVTLNFSGSSSTSGVTYYYGTSTSSMTSTGSSVSYSTNTSGVTYYVKACNGAGTCSGNSSYQIKLDKSTPATPTITASDGKTSGSWHTANVTLNFSGASSTSGITYYYGTSTSSMTSTGSSVSYSTNTSGVTYYVKACNGAGTCSSNANYQIKLDKATLSSPTITASDGITSGNWHTANVTLNFSGASSTSGVTYYYGTSTSPSTAGSSVSYTSNTSGVTYYVKVCNGAGTCSGNSSYQIKLDKTTLSAPTISASDSIGSGSWHTANFTLSFSGASSTSGVTYYYGTSSSPSTAGSSVSISSATSGTTYYAKVCNGAGTCSSNASYSVKLDKTKPTVSYNVAGGSYTTTKTVTITASDTNFSSMTVETYKDGTKQSGKSVSGRTSNTYSVALDSGGNWTIYTKVYDAAGQVQSTTPQNSNSFYYQEYTITLCAYSTGQVWNYDYTGGIQSFSVPCSGTYKLEVWGAAGGSDGSATGGKGGYSYGSVALTQSTNLYIGVGGAGANASAATGGYNGGGYGAGGHVAGDGNGGGGGGATHIAKTNNRGVLSSYSSYRSEVLIVAGGGGGAISTSFYWDDEEEWYESSGGSGGGTNGGATTCYGWENSTGASATQSSGYAFGQGDLRGGGGYYGGYCGGSTQWAGGGGSGYIGGVSSGSMSNGQRSGNGYARITLQSIS